MIAGRDPAHPCAHRLDHSGTLVTQHQGWRLAEFALERVYDATPASTLAFAYGYHLGGFIPVTLVGLWFIRSVGLSMKEMSRSEDAVEEAVEGDAALAPEVATPVTEPERGGR